MLICFGSHASVGLHSSTNWGSSPQVAFVDLDGNVLGIGNGSICIVTQDNELIVPPAEDIIRGLTMERILELIPEV